MTDTTTDQAIDEVLIKLENDVAHDVQKRITQHSSGRSPKSSHAEAKAALSQLLANEVRKAETRARINEVETAIKMTLNTWHIKSPFTNIENIDANTIASTSQYLLTRKAQLKGETTNEN